MRHERFICFLLHVLRLYHFTSKLLFRIVTLCRSNPVTQYELLKTFQFGANGRHLTDGQTDKYHKKIHVSHVKNGPRRRGSS